MLMMMKTEVFREREKLKFAGGEKSSFLSIFKAKIFPSLEFSQCQQQNRQQQSTFLPHKI